MQVKPSDTAVDTGREMKRRESTMVQESPWSSKYSLMALAQELWPSPVLSLIIRIRMEGNRSFQVFTDHSNT